MKNYGVLYFLIAFFSIFSISQDNAYASHAMGADLSYKCLGNNQYEITLSFYRDCTGSTAPSSASILIASNSCGQSISARLLRVASLSGIEVTPLCPSQLSQSSCNGGTIPGVELYVYRGVVTLPVKCTDWNVSWSFCCRNSAITNLNNPSSQNLYIQANINNTLSTCNSSPIFTELPTPYICDGQLYNYNHGAVDPDGDSLVFSLINPMTTNGSSIAYNTAGGYSGSNKMLSTGPIVFNPGTGQMTIKPAGQQVGVIAVKVEEYRNGKLIGTTMRDIQIVVISCTNIYPEALCYTNITKAGYVKNCNTIEVCPGDSLHFEIIALDSNSTDSIKMTTNFMAKFPNSSFSSTGVNPVTGVFDWVPSISDTGFHFFILTVRDNACPVFGSQTYAYKIRVLTRTKASEDRIYCDVGKSAKLSAKGGSIFSWSPTTEIVASNADSSQIEVRPLITTDYIVSSNLSAQCVNRDTVRVTVVPSFTHGISLNDTICKYQTSELEVTPQAQYGPYGIVWEPASSLNSSSLPLVTSSTLTTQVYTVEMTSVAGCIVEDIVEVNIKGEAPNIFAIAEQNFYCPGESLPIEVIEGPTTCGVNTTGCGTNEDQTIQVGKAEENSSISPLSGFYSDGKMQMLFKKEELNRNGLYGGIIKGIAFDVSTIGNNTKYNSLRIQIACTSLEGFTSGIENINGVNVKAPSQFTVLSDAWNYIQFDQAYEWDGESNLVIDICYNNSSGSANHDVRASRTSFNSVAYANAGSGNGCALVGGTISGLRPNVQFLTCQIPFGNYTVSWSPSLGLDNPDISNPVVSGLQKNQRYLVQVDNVGCISTDSIDITPDLIELEAYGDTDLCLGDTVVLGANVGGQAPTGSLPCGTASIIGSGYIQEVELGGMQNTSSVTPFEETSEDVKFQVLYKAHELREAGIESGIIRGLSFELGTKGSTNPCVDFNINMDCTSANSLDVSQWQNAGHTVYSSSNFNTKSGWNSITLDQTFNWDGVSNIIVQFCWNNPSGQLLGGQDELVGGNTSFNSVLIAGKTNGDGCSIAKPLQESSFRMNTLFSVERAKGTFVFNWLPETGVLSPVDSQSLVVPTESGTYTLNTQSINGCIVDGEIDLIVNKNIPIVGLDQVICFGESAPLTSEGAESYDWSPSNSLNRSDKDRVSASPSETTIYTLVSIDEKGCAGVAYIEVVVNPLPLAYAGEDTTILRGRVTELSASGGISYFWSPSASLDDPYSATPRFSADQSTTFIVEVTDDNNCINHDTVYMEVKSELSIVAPNVFTPNANGDNDYFRIYPKGESEFINLRVYNRWGQVVFEGRDFEDSWDGTKEGQEQPIGVYVYSASTKNLDGEILNFKGNITLLR